MEDIWPVHAFTKKYRRRLYTRDVKTAILVETIPQNTNCEKLLKMSLPKNNIYANRDKQDRSSSHNVNKKFKPSRYDAQMSKIFFNMSDDFLFDNLIPYLDHTVLFGKLLLVNKRLQRLINHPKISYNVKFKGKVKDQNDAENDIVTITDKFYNGKPEGIVRHISNKN